MSDKHIRAVVRGAETADTQSNLATGPPGLDSLPLHSLALDGIAQQQQRLTGTGRAETLRTHQAHKIFYVPRIDDGSLTGDVVIGIGWPLRFEARAVLGWVS